MVAKHIFEPPGFEPISLPNIFATRYSNLRTDTMSSILKFCETHEMGLEPHHQGDVYSLLLNLATPMNLIFRRASKLELAQKFRNLRTWKKTIILTWVWKIWSDAARNVDVRLWSLSFWFRIVFCTSCLPLARTWWVRSTSSSHYPLSSNQRHQFFLRGNSGSAEIGTWGCWVRNKYATSVLCSQRSESPEFWAQSSQPLENSFYGD